MRKTLSIIAVAAATFTAAPQLATAAPLQDQVSGKGSITNQGELNFSSHVSARSGSQGQAPRGSFTINWTSTLLQDRQVSVSCMVVVGNTAVVGGLDSTGTETFLKIEDNGVSGDRMGDALGLPNAQAPDQQRCAAVFASLGEFNIFPVSGDFTVIDN